MDCTKCKSYRGLEADSKFFYIKCDLECDNNITLRPFIDDVHGEKVVVCPKKNEDCDILMH